MQTLPLGPVLLDVAGTTLSKEERQCLLHPQAGGVILFARNYTSLKQLEELCAEIHDLRTPPLLIAVDHEGGRVQRFREGFTPIPPMRHLGRLYDKNPLPARQFASQVGLVLASELRVCGVALSFTPVLDIDYGHSQVIGDRALHHTPEGVANLAQYLIQGLRIGGMPAIAKHFPGHGYASADSHTDPVLDLRELSDLRTKDLYPYQILLKEYIDGIMPAHVTYPNIDQEPAGYSSFWLQQVLRKEYGFQGIIFSDDLCMTGANIAGDNNIVTRAVRALKAGCDCVLVCNQPTEAKKLLEGLGNTLAPFWSLATSQDPWAKLRQYPSLAKDRPTLLQNPQYLEARQSIMQISADYKM